MVKEKKERDAKRGIAREYYSIAAYHLEDFLHYRYAPEMIVYEFGGKLRQCYVKEFIAKISEGKSYVKLLRLFAYHLRNNSTEID